MFAHPLIAVFPHEPKGGGKPSARLWMESEQDVLCTDQGVLFSSKKGGNSGACYHRGKKRPSL